MTADEAKRERVARALAAADHEEELRTRHHGELLDRLEAAIDAIGDEEAGGR